MVYEGLESLSDGRINNPVLHGDRGWPPGLRPALYDEAAGYYEVGMTPCESFFTNSHPKESCLSQKFQEWTETTENPKSCSRDRHLTSPSDGCECTSGLGHFPKSWRRDENIVSHNRIIMVGVDICIVGLIGRLQLMAELILFINSIIMVLFVFIIFFILRVQ